MIDWTPASRVPVAGGLATGITPTAPHPSALRPITTPRRLGCLVALPMVAP